MSSVPPSLKPVAGYFKLASDVEERDPVVAYWIRVCVMQKSLKIDSKSPEAKMFLIGIMDKLEKDKDALKDNEAVTTDIVGQAYVENYAQKLFESADGEDRSASATLKTVRTFLACVQVFEVLSVFEPLTDEVVEKQRYAKYRASVIMKALKAGETPPPPENIDGQLQTIVKEDEAEPTTPYPNETFATMNSNILQPPYPSFGGSSGSTPMSTTPPAPPAPTPVIPSPCSHSENASVSGLAMALNGVELSPKKLEKAGKLCKYAQSAMLYDDVRTAVDNLEKALHILKTGQEAS